MPLMGIEGGAFFPMDSLIAAALRAKVRRAIAPGSRGANLVRGDLLRRGTGLAMARALPVLLAVAQDSQPVPLANELSLVRATK